MSTFIKAGFWEKRNLAPKHWLNLDLLISSIVPSAFPYKSFIGHLYQPGGPTSGVPPQLGVIYNTLGTVTAELDADSGLFIKMVHKNHYYLHLSKIHLLLQIDPIVLV